MPPKMNVIFVMFYSTVHLSGKNAIFSLSLFLRMFITTYKTSTCKIRFTAVLSLAINFIQEDGFSIKLHICCYLMFYINNWLYIISWLQQVPKIDSKKFNSSIKPYENKVTPFEWIEWISYNSNKIPVKKKSNLFLISILVSWTSKFLSV